MGTPRLAAHSEPLLTRCEVCELQVDGVGESLNLALLVCSAANLSLIFLYWSYLLYSSFSLSALMPPVFPHVILLSISIGKDEAG